MTENSSVHWAADEETLERFVLGRLSESERAAAEAHIASCSSCADAVRAERRLAAGARRLGRDSLKASLRRRTVEFPERSVRWPAMLSAAAVIGILIGVGFYNDWFSGKIQEISTVAEDRRVAEFARPEEQEKAERRVDASAADSKEHKKDVARAEADKPAPLPAHDPATEGNQIAGADARGDVAAAPATSKESAPLRMRDEDGARKTSLSFPTGSWTEGVLLERTGEPVSAGLAAKVEAESRALNMEKNARAKTADALSVGEQSVKTQAGNYRINQRPTSELPGDRQMYQRQSARNTVQTLVEQRGALTTLTLYLDSLADDRELSGANVSNVTGDSVIVTLGKQRIGYKLPSGPVGRQQNAGK